MVKDDDARVVGREPIIAQRVRAKVHLGQDAHLEGVVPLRSGKRQEKSPGSWNNPALRQHSGKGEASKLSTLML